MNVRPARFIVTLGLAACALGGPLSPRIGAQGSPIAPIPGTPASDKVPILRDVGIDQRLNDQLPLDTPFVDEKGRDVTLGQYFGQRPVVMVLSYFDCPMLCSQVIGSMVGSLMTLPFNAGKDFEVVVASFNPGDTPAMAAAKHASYVQRYGRPGTEGGFHFLTGRPESIAKLTTAVGFRYAYDSKIGQYAHPATVMVVTPEGRMSRYLFGIEFGARDLRFSLVEAGNGRIGSVVDQALLFCYHYDPESGKYGFAIMNSIRVAGLLTLGGLGAFIFVTLRRERRQDSAVSETATGTR